MGCNWPQAPVSLRACHCAAVQVRAEDWLWFEHMCGCFTCSYWTQRGLWLELRVSVFCLRVSVLSVHVVGKKANDPLWANISLQRHSCHARVKLFAKRVFFFFWKCYVITMRRGGLLTTYLWSPTVFRRRSQHPPSSSGPLEVGWRWPPPNQLPHPGNRVPVQELIGF